MRAAYAASLFLVVIAAAPSCAVAQATGQAGGAGFTRSVSGIPVQDRDGRPMAAPWFGGFNVPRPQLVDIDGDGRMELFVQERSGEIALFREKDGQWLWQTDRYHDLDVGEWYRFVDLDGDGRIDLVGEAPFSYIRAWRNVGTREEARFEIWADTLRDAGGAAIFADRQNILNIVDIDCNGRLDMFIGKVEGIIDRYEAIGSGPDGLPSFALIEHRWEGIEIVGDDPTVPRPSLHGANTMSFGDLDGDGDLDLLWGDFFEAGLLLIENHGTECGAPWFEPRLVNFPVGLDFRTTGYNAPSIGDIDGDGLPDVVVGVIGGAFQPTLSLSDNLYLLRQEAPGRWQVATSRLVSMIDVGSESIPLLVDYDGDGDLDLLVGNRADPGEASTATITLFENVGSGTAPLFRDRGSIGVTGTYHMSPTMADLDGDGLPELIVGTWTDQVQRWRNAGTAAAPRWQLADSALVTITRGSNTTPTFADLDGDGDLDLIVGEASGQLNLYRNDGTRTEPRFTLVSDSFQDIDVGRRSHPLLVDLDGSGRHDLLIGADTGVLELWRRVGSGADIRFERDPGFELRSDANLAPAIGDLFGTGRPDLLTGGDGGGVRLFRRDPGR